MRSEHGYVLLVLLLLVAFLSIASLKVIEDFKYQSQRDREDEMIHRGCQYTRAVKRYFRNSGAIQPESKIWRVRTVSDFCANVIKTR